MFWPRQRPGPELLADALPVVLARQAAVRSRRKVAHIRVIRSDEGPWCQRSMAVRAIAKSAICNGRNPWNAPLWPA